MIVKIRKVYNIESDVPINDALESCVVKRDSNHLVNTMELIYRRDGEHASLFVVGAIIYGYEERAGFIWDLITDAYIITYIKISGDIITATAEETCRYILRRCVVFPTSSPGGLADAMNAMFYQAVPRPDYQDRYYYRLTTNYSGSSTSCPIDFKTPITFLNALKGSEGSIADITHFKITLSSKLRISYSYLSINIDIRPYSDTVSDYIVHGREIIEASFEQDMNYYVVRTAPYWKGTVNDVETVIVNGSPYIGRLNYLCDAADVVDLSGKYTEAPTMTQVWDEGAKYGRERRAMFDDGNYYVKIQDGMTYRKYNANLEETSTQRRINADIGNLISITLEDGSKIAARVTATEYDMLRERYTKIDLGEKIDNFSRMLAKDIKR